MMRFVTLMMAGCALGLMAGVAQAGEAAPTGASMRALFEEMKSHAEAEKTYRDTKKTEVVDLESKIDKIRAEAKAKGATKDPDSVKPLQIQRLNLLEEVARRDVQVSEEGVQFAQRKLEIAKQNLMAFEQKKKEALKVLGA